MSISRRNFGIGLLAASATATAGAVGFRDSPYLRGMFGDVETLTGFVGGEKMGYIREEQVADLLRGHGLVVDARQAGSIEMVGDPRILDQKPDFLWPSSQPMIDLARSNGVKILREDVVLNSPIVFYSWENVATALVASGLASHLGGSRYSIDTKALLDAVVDGRTWKDLGIPDLYGAARIVSTDPAKSNSGYVFAGLAANAFAGDVADMASVSISKGRITDLFSGMGYKTHSSGKLFEDYLAGGPGASPLIVGYENQLVEWILADPDRWAGIEKNAPTKPVVFYPSPTVFTAHPLLILSERATGLLDALKTPEAQKLAWTINGFRGPLGSFESDGNATIDKYVEKNVKSVVPMPDADVMTALTTMLAV